MYLNTQSELARMTASELDRYEWALSHWQTLSAPWAGYRARLSVDRAMNEVSAERRRRGLQLVFPETL